MRFLTSAVITAMGAGALASALHSQPAPVVTNPAPNINAAAFRISAQPALRMGGLNENANYEFSAIWQADITETGKLVVLPARGVEVRVFDIRGRHLRTLGRRGDGPGEFAQAIQLTALGGDSIALYDNINQRVTLFDVATGNVVGEMSQAPNALCCFRDATFLVSERAGRPSPLEQATAPEVIAWGLASGPRGSVRMDSVLVTRGNDPEIRLGRFEDPPGPSGERRWTLPAAAPPFGRTASTIIAGGTIVYGVSDRYEFRVHSPSGSLLRTVRVAVPAVAVTRADIEAARKVFMSGADTPERARAYQEQFEKLKLYATLPFFGRVLGVRDGGFWAQHYMKPGTTAQWWSRFDAQGRFLGVMRTPDNMTVRRFTPEYVVLAPDERPDGVAMLLVHRIETQSR